MKGTAGWSGHLLCSKVVGQLRVVSVPGIRFRKLKRLIFKAKQNKVMQLKPYIRVCNKFQLEMKQVFPRVGKHGKIVLHYFNENLWDSIEFLHLKFYL